MDAEELELGRQLQGVVDEGRPSLRGHRSDDIVQASILLQVTRPVLELRQHHLVLGHFFPQLLHVAFQIVVLFFLDRDLWTENKAKLMFSFARWRRMKIGLK